MIHFVNKLLSILVIMSPWGRGLLIGANNEHVPELPVVPGNIGSPASLPRLVEKDGSISFSSVTNAAEYENGKHIPRLLWIAVKDRKDELPSHMRDLFKGNSEWVPQVCDNDCKDYFISTYFKGTMIEWVYNLIDIGAFKADVWRYSVLYVYGGGYLDDDSNIQTPLDEVVKDTDYLIMSEEGANGFGPCYEADFRLSDTATSKLNKTDIEAVSKKYFHGYDSGVPQFFHGHTLVNWGLFMCPRHPLMIETLKNIVEVVTSEYRRKSVLHITRWDPPHKIGLCTTTFIMTYTLRELLIKRYFDVDTESGDNKGEKMLPRVLVSDYREYGGKCKAIWTGADPEHYSKRMKRSPKLLKTYLTLDVDDVIASLHGKAVMGEGKSKSIYYVDGNQKREFGSFDNFLDCGFTMDDVRHVSSKIISRLVSAEAKQCTRKVS